jgi:hypothetical protein
VYDQRMRRVAKWVATIVLATAAASTPCHAASLSIGPSKPAGFWAGTRLTLAAERASRGQLRVHVEGTVAVRSPARVSLYTVGCSAGTDSISSYGWTPEHHPAGAQAVASWPAHLNDDGRYLKLRLQGKTRVSYSKTVSYGFPGETPRWTDCVTLELWRVGASGSYSSPAFDSTPSAPTPVDPHPQDPIDNTLFVTLTINATPSPTPYDGRHIECGPPPAFCPLQRPKQFIPPAFPDFPPAPGYPGSPGNPTAPVNYPYQVPVP